MTFSTPDVSSQILSKLDSVSFHSLDSTIASSWRAELDESIRLTKVPRPSSLVIDNLTGSRRNAFTTVYMPTCLRLRLNWPRQGLLSNDCKILRMTWMRSTARFPTQRYGLPLLYARRAHRVIQIGLTPTLLAALRTHQALAQASLNADVLHASLAHLAECKTRLERAQHLVESGDLPAAVPASAKLAQLLDTTPSPLGEATVTSDIRVCSLVARYTHMPESTPQSKLRVLTNRLEELLNNAYSQGVAVSSTDIVIRPFVPGWSLRFVQSTVNSDIHSRAVPNSENPIPLSAVLSSLSSSSLSAHMTSLRRDITTHCMEHTLDHPIRLSFSQEPDQFGSFIHRMQRHPSLSSTDHGTTPLGDLSRILEFMSDKLFPCLPQSQRDTFPRSLAKPLTTAIMTRLLIPLLPSKLDALPTFLELTRTSVDFETKYIVGLLKGDTVDREIRNWVDNVCAHYERGRRQRILDDVRETILASVSRPKDTFSAELVTATNITQPSVEPSPPVPVTTDKWNLNDSRISKTDSSGSSIDAGDAWGFDDAVEEPEEPPAPVSKPNSDSLKEPEPDPNEAWGWNDELAEEQAETSTQDSTEIIPTEQDEVWDDDPWADNSVANEVTLPDRPPVASSLASRPQPAPAASSSRQQPLSNGRPQTNGHVPNGHHPPSNQSQNSDAVNKETYSVSVLVRRIVQTVEDALHEGEALVTSGIFSKPPLSMLTPGTLIMQSGAMALDLYRALHPVVAASRLSQPAGRMQFSNDCYYLSEEMARMLKHEKGLLSVQDRLEECKNDLKILADSWFHQSIVSDHYRRRNPCSYRLCSTSGQTSGGSGAYFSGCGWFRGYV